MTSDRIPICFALTVVVLYLLHQVLFPSCPFQEACDNVGFVRAPLLSHAPSPNATAASYEIFRASLSLLSYIKTNYYLINVSILNINYYFFYSITYISSSNRYSSSRISASNSATLSSLRFSRYFLRDSTRSFGSSFSLASVSIILRRFAASAIKRNNNKL